MLPDHQPEPADIAALHGLEQVSVPVDGVHQLLVELRVAIDECVQVTEAYPLG